MYIYQHEYFGSIIVKLYTDTSNIGSDILKRYDRDFNSNRLLRCTHALEHQRPTNRIICPPFLKWFVRPGNE